MKYFPRQFTEMGIDKRFHFFGMNIEPIEIVIPFKQRYHIATKNITDMIAKSRLLHPVAPAIQGNQIQEIDIVMRQDKGITVEKPVLKMVYQMFHHRIPLIVNIMRPQIIGGIRITPTTCPTFNFG